MDALGLAQRATVNDSFQKSLFQLYCSVDGPSLQQLVSGQHPNQLDSFGLLDSHTLPRERTPKRGNIVSIEDLHRAVFRRCWDADTNIWKIAHKCGWDFADATSFVRANSIPNDNMLQDLARELHLDIESLRNMPNRP